MKVVITGGAGFLGRLLAAELIAERDRAAGSSYFAALDQITLLDLAEPPASLLDERLVSSAVGDLSDRELLTSVVAGDDVCVFHLASMVSAECEQDFDRAMRVNLTGTMNLLEACRSAATRARLVFTSSIVAFGGRGSDEVVSDTTPRTPETTYGTTKAICELLINDYTRKGFLDGRTARLPTVVIRPGKPNAAASGWVSGIAREPLRGVATAVPVAPDLSIPVAGYRTTIANLVRFAGMGEHRLDDDRAYSFPSIDVQPEAMVEAIGRVAGVPSDLITYRADPAVEEFFSGWAHHAEYGRALELGLVADADFDAIIREFVEDAARATP